VCVCVCVCEVISETGALSSDVHISFSNGGPAT